MVLDPGEYDISYFDGKKSSYTHNAGYSKYQRWFRTKEMGSSGEYFYDKAKELIEKYSFTGSLLEIGCAKGFQVKDFRDLGVEAYGVDVSAYAIGEAEADVVPYLTIADIRTHISTYSRNGFDVIYSARFLECIDDTDLPQLISEMNRVGKRQIHIIDENLRTDFYNSHPLSWWVHQGFARGTVLVSYSTGEVVVV